MDAELISAANNKFGLDLYKILFPSTFDKNTFISPFSISVALAMTQTGASGNTAKEMSQTLAWGTENEEKIHKQFQAFISWLQKPVPEYQLSTANRIYVERNYTILEEFQKKTRECYFADSVKANFRGDPESERKGINSWVAEQTHNKIKELLGPKMVTSDVRMILVNAIYFKGKWNEQFEQDKTCPEPFKIAPGETKKVPMMKKIESCRFTISDTLKCSAVDIPYKGYELSMVIILPTENFGLQELVSNLTYEKFTGLLQDIDSNMAEVELSLPRFEVTSSFELSRSLMDLGMVEAFGGGADFSAITGNKELSISAAVHKAFILVNEEGTEAAAATGDTMLEASCMEMCSEVMTVDHPFLYLIRDLRSSTVLFMGHIADPSVGTD